MLTKDRVQVSPQDPAWFRALSLQERRALLRYGRTADGAAGSGSTVVAGGAAERGAAAEPDPRTARRLRLWREQSPFDEGSWFDRRLAVEDLDEASLAALLAVPAESLRAAAAEPEEWMALFVRAMEDEAGRSRDELPTLPGPDSGPLAFVRLVAPLLVPAAHRVLDRAREAARGGVEIDAWEAVSSLFGRFVPRLAAQVSRVGVLELHVAKLEGDLPGDDPASRFAAFISRLEDDEFRLRLFREYPVLARLATTLIRQWEESAVEFFDRLEADWESLVATFAPAEGPGRLVSIATDAGDRHRDGRTVFQLRFEPGWRLVYKPRPLSLDVHFGELLAWIAERGGPEHRFPRTLDRDGYGWCEFIEMAATEEPAGIERFYQRLGSLLGLLYVLGASDFHRDNLIAAGDQPVLVDSESILSPRLLPPNVADASVRAAERVRDSVLRVGILPERERGDRRGPGIDNSGLGGAAGQKSRHGLPRWEATGTDEMRLVRHPDVASPAKNRPTLRGEEVDPEGHVGDLVAGYQRMAAFLEEHREELAAPGGPLDRFAGDPVRVILRHTRFYGLLLYEGTHPDVLRDALDRERVFDRLWYGLEEGEELDLLAPRIAGEKQELWNGDVPYFSTLAGSRDLWTGTGEHVPGFFAATALDEVRRRLARLDAADQRRQTWFIHASMTALTLESDPHLRRRASVAAEAPATADELLAEAVALGDGLARSAVRGEGDATWIGLTRSPQRGWVVVPAGFDLYSGLAGIALFLAYLGEVTGDGDSTALARSSLTACRKLLERHGRQMTWLGGYGGWGGLIHAWTHFGALWDEREWVDEALAMAQRLPDLLAEDECLDVLAGSAGAIRPLLALGRLSGSGRPLEIAVQLGDFLLARAMECPSGVGWGVDLSPRVPLTGFSHGAAGFTWALALLHEATGEGRFRDAALRSLDYEDSLHATEAGNWPDLRSLGEEATPPASVPDGIGFMNAWCHGAPGIGLARLDCLGLLDDPRIGSDLEAALATTRRRGFGGSHSLCHGELGNLELLLAAALRRNGAGAGGPGGRREAGPLDPEVARLATTVLRGRPDGRWLCGVPAGVATPGLMVGLAGIGYELLRLAAPHRVPSILTLEPPIGV